MSSYQLQRLRPLLIKGCRAYMATITKVKPTNWSMESIEVGIKFPNVLPEQLPWCPPNGETKFSIKLVPYTTLVLKASYRMAQMSYLS